MWEIAVCTIRATLHAYTPFILLPQVPWLPETSAPDGSTLALWPSGTTAGVRWSVLYLLPGLHELARVAWRACIAYIAAAKRARTASPHIAIKRPVTRARTRDAHTCSRTARAKGHGTGLTLCACVAGHDPRAKAALHYSRALPRCPACPRRPWWRRRRPKNQLCAGCAGRTSRGRVHGQKESPRKVGPLKRLSSLSFATLQPLPSGKDALSRYRSSRGLAS